MPHSFERRDIEYKRWVRILKVILLTRFGLAVDDSFEETQLKNFFNCGDSPIDVAGELKRELVDIKNHKLPTKVES